MKKFMLTAAGLASVGLAGSATVADLWSSTSQSTDLAVTPSSMTASMVQLVQ